MAENSAARVGRRDTGASIIIDAHGPPIRRGATEIETHSDIVYSTPTTGDTAVELMMDVIVPRTGGRKPLVVRFPGGGFLLADRKGALSHRSYVAEAGYVVASVQYRTVTDGATYRDSVADAKSAIRYLRAHAHRYSIDPRRVAAWGESAGGYIAAMVGTTHGVEQFDVGENLDKGSDVRAVIDQFGPSDLSKIGAGLDPATLGKFLGPGGSTTQWVSGSGTKLSVGDATGAIARANPIAYGDATEPPFLLFHGTADKVVSPNQTLLLHEALRAKGVESTRYLVAGAGHGDTASMGDAKSGRAWSTQEVMNIMVSFLDEHLKN